MTTVGRYSFKKLSNSLNIGRVSWQLDNKILKMRGSPINNLRSQQEGASPYQRGTIRRASDKKEVYDGSPDRLVSH